MELTQIHYFLEVAQSEHITQSARRLHIAQPALSQAIRRLEEELGVPLFAREGRNITITKYGQYLKEKLTPFMQTLSALPHELSELQKTEQQTIYINVLAASSLLIDAVIAFRARHEEIRVKLLQSSEEKNFDLEISTRLFAEGGGKDSPLSFSCPERIFLAVPREGQYAGQASVRLGEMGREGFIGLMGSRPFRAVCDTLCHRAGIRPNYIFESDSPAAVQNMIAANMGVGFWPEFSWGEPHNPKVARMEVSDVLCGRDILVSLNPAGHNRIAELFFDFLKTYLERIRTEKGRGD